MRGVIASYLPAAGSESEGPRSHRLGWPGSITSVLTIFKAIKQSLRIKTFVGTSPNGVMIQIWTALIAMLFLRYLQLRATYGWSLSNLVALLRQQLFVYRDLMAWLNQPFEPPPELTEQLLLPLT